MLSGITYFPFRTITKRLKELQCYKWIVPIT
jgi:hypothetical protein